MMINHPLLGPRDVSEFYNLGDAEWLNRPDGMANGAEDAMFNYVYMRENPAGVVRELWYHEQGDRSWLVVTRSTLTHEITSVELARDAVKGGAA